MSRHAQRGMTLAEALVSIAITGMFVVVSTSMLTTAHRGTQDNINKQFATQKAISMLEELRSLVQSGSGTNAVVLDQFDDGVTNRMLLTTQSTITDPASPASGNTQTGRGRWLYERRVSVQKIAGANDLRVVNVKVFINERGGQRLLAEVASVLSTVGQNSPPTQVYDIYLIAIENIPGWWVYMQDVVPFVESAMADLEARQPGLQFRRHWIRKLSYGRDPYYTPYVNRTNDSTAAIDQVYFYPGLMPSGSAVNFYYPPDFFSGRVRVDSDVTGTYSLADQYNNALRYPEERALFDARVAASQESADTPTLRLLLDDMYMHPSRYKNAIIINLHGELFPFPPVRNYSDAAKDPAQWPNVRAVTHPELLRYTNSDALRLRVYSYGTGTVPNTLNVPVTVTLKNIRYTASPNDVASISGGIANAPYSLQVASMTPGASMYWSSRTNGADTVFTLYNSPLKSPCVTVTNPCDQGGLSSAAQLYGLEYIPSPVENLPDGASPNAFTTNLATHGDVEKNTARWIITIPSSALPSNATIEVDTQLGDSATPAPANTSRTYAWRGTDAWIFGDATTDANLPITERFQFLGDPRHCPYADLKMPHGSSGRTRANALGMGYNRYFDDFESTARNAAASWPGWSYDAPQFSGNMYGIKNDGNANNDGWDTRSGLIEVDVPRIYQVLRSSVVRSHSVYTTMTGFSYYYVGIGNEIGYDASNGFTNSIPVSAKPFTGAGGSRNEQSITNDLSGGVKYIRENAGGNYWWSMSWLGELAPDSQWATWTSTGNLPTGTGAGTFSRVLRSTITPNLPAGTAFVDTVRRTQEEGSTTFFWSGSAGSTFHHRYQDNTTGSLDTDGNDIASTYDLPLPASIANARPFDINVNDTSMNPDHFLQPVYGSATTLRTLARFYRHSTNIQGSSLLAMRDGSDAAFVVVNGLSPTGTSGVSFISRWSFLSLVQSFLAGGLYSTAGSPDASRVRELPRVAITTPNDDVDLRNPSTIHIAWTSQWLRWDALRYTPSYSATWSDDTTVRFATIYSRDNGQTWLNMRDESPAQPGVRPSDPANLITATSYDWAVPADRFPKGNYIIRIEAYRDEVPLHYAFHQYRAFIKR